MQTITSEQFLVFIPLFFLASCALSLLLTRVLITLLPVFGFVDIPRGRHQHERIVPRGGGLAFIIAFAVNSFFYFFLTEGAVSGIRSAARQDLLLELGVPLLIITILGLLDDRFELSSKVKLFIQLSIAVFFYFTGAGFDLFLGFTLPSYIALPLTVVWVVGITNAFNLIDGMDGVAAGLALISAFSLAIWLFISRGASDGLMLLLIFCGALLGFLKYNFAPAKIFMGDTGSLFIGTFFAYFSLVESTKSMTFTSLMVPVLAMGVPIFDVFLAIIRRLYRKYIRKEPGVGVMTGDHDHIHHRIQDETKDQKKTALTLYVLAFLLVGGAMAAALVNDTMQILSFAILLSILFFMIRFATIELYDTATLISKGIRQPQLKHLFIAVHPMVDILLLLTAYFFVSFLFHGNSSYEPLSMKQMLCFLAPYPLVLGLSGIYKTFWLRAGIVRFFKLFLMLLLASVFVLALVVYMYAAEYDRSRDFLAYMQEFYFVFVLFSGSLIMAERFLLHYLESAGFKMLGARVESRRQEFTRTVVYGGGLYCRLFLAAQYTANGEKAERKVVGLIDDNRFLHGLNVYGLDVLGSSGDLPAILKKYEFDEIVVALREIPEDTRRFLDKFGRENNIKIKEFRISLEELSHTEGDLHTEKTIGE